MNKDRIELLRSAFDSYLAEPRDLLEPKGAYLSYDFDFVRTPQWHLLGEEMVLDELRELTNIVNHWHSDLNRWHAWNKVIGTYEEKEAWELRIEFLEALAHKCLLQPSAVRDKITFIATNAFHQTRISHRGDYKDYLDGDPKKPDGRQVHLNRARKEKRLEKLVSYWPESDDFIQSLRLINDKSHQEESSDYRNRASHSIAPRLGIGITQVVVRNVVQATERKKQPDGTYREETVPGKMNVQYSWGGMHPIDLEKARISNLHQYHLAYKCYMKFKSLLQMGISEIRPKQEGA